MKGSQISLSLISSCCYNNAIKLLTLEGKVSEFAYQEQQTARASVHTSVLLFQSFVTPFANKPPVPRRGVIHHLLLSLLRPSKKKRKTRRTTREKKKDLNALALGGKKLTKSFSKRRRSGVYLHRRRRRRRLPLCEVRTLSLSLASPRNPKNPPQRGQWLLPFFRGISSTSLRRSCFRSLLAGWDLPGRGGTAVTSCDKGEKRQTTATHHDEEGGGRRKGSKRNAWHPATCVRLSTRRYAKCGGRESLSSASSSSSSCVSLFPSFLVLLLRLLSRLFVVLTQL